MPDFTFEHATDGGVHCEVLDEASNVVRDISLSDAAPVENGYGPCCWSSSRYGYGTSREASWHRKT
jgi:hypothetical protein